jgi:hypothetical protein
MSHISVFMFPWNRRILNSVTGIISLIYHLYSSRTKLQFVTAGIRHLNSATVEGFIKYLYITISSFVLVARRSHKLSIFYTSF